MTRAVLGGLAVAAVLSVLPAHAQTPVNKVPVMAVTGCLAGQGGDWSLTSATDPTPSIANGPPAAEPVKGPTTGRNTYRLIGTSEFDMAAHAGHTVLVKGLFIKASPVSRVNVTSVTRVATTCAPAPK